MRCFITKLQVRKYNLQVTVCIKEITHNKSQVTSYIIKEELQVTGQKQKLQGTREKQKAQATSEIQTFQVTLKLHVASLM